MEPLKKSTSEPGAIHPLQAPLEDLQNCVKSIQEGIDANGDYFLARKRLKLLHNKCLNLKFQHKELFDLQMKTEEAVWILSTIRDLGIQTDECSALIEKLGDLSGFITREGEDSDKEISQKLEHVRNTIQLIRESLEEFAKENSHNSSSLIDLSNEFRRIHYQLKNQVYKKPLSEEELHTLRNYKASCQKLRAVHQKEFMIELRIEQARTILDEITTFKPNLMGTQRLSNNLNLYILSLIERKGDPKEYYEEIQQDLKRLFKEIELCQASLNPVEKIKPQLSLFDKFWSWLINSIKSKKQ